MSRTFAREGLCLNVEETAGAGPPVVFQHGLCGDAAQPAEVFPEGLRHLTLECRGHGRSEAGPLERVSIAAFADDVAALLDELREAAVLGGISMGAAIALRLAVRRPERLRGLVLARPAWLFSPAPANMAANAEVGRLLATLPREAAREAFLAGPVAAELAAASPDNLASLTGFFDREPVEVTAALLQTISADGPGVSERQARAIRLPTLIVATARDLIHPLAHAEALAAAIPGARLVVIPAKSVDRAAYVREFRAALAAFLRGLD